MRRENNFGFALSAALLALSVLSFSDTARAQSVTLTPTVLNFTGSANQIVTQCNGGTDCKVHVTGSGVGTVQVQVSSQAASWLRISPNVANLLPAADLNVSVDTSMLNAGSSSGTFIVYSSSNSTIQQSVTVNVTVANSSQLSATPNSLTFQAQLGATFGTPQSGTCPVQNGPASCQVTIQTTSTTPITYNITPSTQDGHPWLQPDAASGRTNGSPFNVAVNPQVIQSLGPGTYLGSILIQSTASSTDTVSINVTLVVSATPTLTVAPAQLNFYYTIGGAVPPAQTATVSASAGSAGFSVSQSPGSTWLNVSPIQGVASPTSSVPLNITVSPTTPVQLGIGAHTATLTISPNAGGAAQTVNVSLYVSVNPFLTVPSNQLQLSFNAPFGGPVPAAQTVAIGSTGGALNFTASASSDQNWLTVSPNGGTTGTASGTISANVSSTVLPTLAVGTYNGTIVLSPTNGDQYNIQITATLTVGAASQITVAPQSLFYSFQIGQATPAAQTVILNASGPPVSFAVATALSGSNPSSCGTASWLGAIAQNQPLTTPNGVTVTVNPQGMTAGTCTGTVKVTYTTTSGNTEVDVPVTLFVSTTPLLNLSLPQGFGMEATTLGGSNIARQISMTSTDNTTAIAYSVTFQSSPCAWLFAAPSTGGSTGNTPTPLQVNILPSCITTPGSYPASITITSPNLPTSAGITLPITLVVTSNVQVAVTPQALAFTQSINGSLPDPQKLNFTVTGGNAPFIATASTDLGSWLQVTPASGSTSLGSISVSVVANNLPTSATPYNGRITLTFQNASTPTAVIPVKYTVNPAQTVSVSPSQSLTFAYQLGGPAPPTQALNVSSTGGAVNFTAGASSTGGWLGVDATSGTTGASGNPKVINISIDPTKIPAGTAAGATLTGAITIGASGVLANPIIVNVNLNITAAAVPQPGSILNSASISATGAGISPGELIAIKGANLGPASPAAGTSFTVNANGTVSSTLAGVQVTFNGTPGIPTFVSATQINVIVPWEVATFSSVSMVISFNQGQSAPLNLNVVATSPAIYTQNATGAGQAAAVNLSPTAASPYNGPLGSNYPGTTLALAPAAQGSFISVFLAGCGQTTPGSVTGAVNPSNTLLPLRGWTQGSSVVTATIGGQNAVVQFAGGAPTLLSGVCQVNLQVPTGVSGNNLPVTVTINGVQSLGSATLAVQ